MTAYGAILAAYFRTQLQYRAAAMAGLAAQVFWGIIKTTVMTAFFVAAKVPPPMSLALAISYTWLSQSLFAIVPIRPDPLVRAMVLEGSVSFELLRPLDVYTMWLIRGVASRSVAIALRALPVLVVAYAFFGLQAPASIGHGLLALLSLAVGILVAAAITALVSIALIWTVAPEGPSQIVAACCFALSGMGVPLPLFPDTLATVVAILPFRAFLDTPIRIYLGHYQGYGLGLACVHQLLWLTLLIAAGKILLHRGLARLTINGG